MVNFTLTKTERLCSRKAFEALITSGISHFNYPFKVHWQKMPNTEEVPVKIAFTVPKRRFKRANKRNLLKRRMREAYRLNKHPLYTFLQAQNCTIHILLVYIASDEISFHEIEKKIKLILDHVLTAIQKDTH